MDSDITTTVIPPPIEPHTHTLIFLHGRGDTAPKFAHSLDWSLTSTNLTLRDHLPTTRLVFPHGLVGPSVGFRSPAVSQWFDVFSVTDPTIREQLQAPGLRLSVERVRRLIAAEIDLLGGAAERVVLAGISQGGATAVHTLLNLDLGEGKGLGGFMGFSCRMPFPGRTLTETRKVLDLEGVPAGEGCEVVRNTKMLLEHCVDDPLVLVDWGRQLRDMLQGFGGRVTWKEYPEGAHWFNSPAGIDDAIDFLKREVPGMVHDPGKAAAGRQPRSGPMELSNSS